MVSAQISSPLERVLFLCAECHPLLSHFKELTVILAHMAPRTVPPPNQDTIETGESAMRNNKFVKIVIWIVVLLVIAGLALPAFTSFFGF
jgi:hypothetical protein